MKDGKRIDVVYAVNTPEVSFREIEGQILLLIPGGSMIHELNESGTWIWRELLRKKPLSKIINGFAKKHKLSNKAAERDVRSFLGSLEKRKIVRILGK